MITLVILSTFENFGKIGIIAINSNSKYYVIFFKNNLFIINLILI